MKQPIQRHRRLFAGLAVLLAILVSGIALAADNYTKGTDNQSNEMQGDVSYPRPSVYDRVNNQWNPQEGGVDGASKVDSGRDFHVDSMDSTDGWSVGGDDTINITKVNEHVVGGGSLEYDKTDGLNNTKDGWIQKTITSMDLSDYWEAETLIHWNLHVTSLANIASCWLRLGTSATIYSSWTLQDTDLTSGVWQAISIPVGEVDFACGASGCIDESAIVYVAVGCTHDAETDLLSDITVDGIEIHAVDHSVATLSAEVTTSVNSPNINLQKVGNKLVTTGIGSVGSGSSASQRIVTANDSPDVIPLSHPDADTKTDCKAITAADVDHTLSVTSNNFHVCAYGGTAFLTWDTAPGVTISVGGFSMAVADGQCHDIRSVETTVGVIGTVAAGFICFSPMAP